jgi:DNA-binding NarL/FixJ family response regulator
MSDLMEHQTIIIRLVRSGRPIRKSRASWTSARGTVKAHLHNIYNKLGIANRYMLTVSESFEE